MRPAGAVAALRETLRLQPKWLVALRFHAEVLLDDGWPALARGEAAKALELARAQAQGDHKPQDDAKQHGDETATCEDLLARTVVAQALTRAVCERRPRPPL